MNDTLLRTLIAPRVAASRMLRYINWLEARRGLRFEDKHALWRWSVNYQEDFRASVWEYFDITAHRCDVLDATSMPGSQSLAGARLNIAEQVFRWHPGDHGERTAVIGISDIRPATQLSWNELRRQVASVAHALRSLGVRRSDRVAAILPNIPEAVVAFYACASIGAVWFICSPDMAAESVADRFRQIAPKLLLVVDGHRCGGLVADQRVDIGELRTTLPSVQHVVHLTYFFPGSLPAGTLEWSTLLEQNCPMAFEPVPFEHPLWIANSSGNAGDPTTAAHGHGAFLLEHLKSCALALGLGEEDRFMCLNAPGSAMRSVQVAGLLVGATICLHDAQQGDRDLAALWRLVAGQRLTAFGAAAAFYTSCMVADIEPTRAGDLSSLRLVACTEQQLPSQLCEWVLAKIGPGVSVSTGVGVDDLCALLPASDLLPRQSGATPSRCMDACAHAFAAGGPTIVD